MTCEENVVSSGQFHTSGPGLIFQPGHSFSHPTRAPTPKTHLVNLAIADTAGCACKPAGDGESEAGRSGDTAGTGCEGRAGSPREGRNAADPETGIG